MKSMTCQQLIENIDDYLDGLSPESSRIDEHVASCADCQNRIARERRLRADLASYSVASVPRPDAGFFDRAIAKAIQQHGHQRIRKNWLRGLGGALAAGLAIWLSAGHWMDQGVSPAPAPPQITMTLDEPRTVNLVFSSAIELRDTTLTLILPSGIEVSGFAGQREISWITSLREGRNVLPLKLVAVSPQGGELMATLQHEDDNKIFKMQITVTDSSS
jgi:anti-sigma factor RsiW